MPELILERREATQLPAMPMPTVPIDEACHPSTWKYDVWAPQHSCPHAIAQAPAEKLSTQRHLRSSACVLDRRHNSRCDGGIAAHWAAPESCFRLGLAAR